jgi:hypothetical protein
MFNNPQQRAKIADYISSVDIPYLLSDAPYPCFLREWCPKQFIRSDIEHILLEGKRIRQICASSDLPIPEHVAFLNSLKTAFAGDDSATNELVLECLEVTWGQGTEYLVIEGALEGWLFAVTEGRVIRGRASNFLVGMERFLETVVGHYDTITDDIL